jgi:hypothetical protein
MCTSPLIEAKHPRNCDDESESCMVNKCRAQGVEMCVWGGGGLLAQIQIAGAGQQVLTLAAGPWAVSMAVVILKGEGAVVAPARQALGRVGSNKL